MVKPIQVNYTTSVSTIQISKALHEIKKHSIISLDFESRSKYSNEDIQRAKECFVNLDEYLPEDQRQIQQVAFSSGLSNPRISKITHASIGVSKSKAYVFVFYNETAVKEFLEQIYNMQVKVIFWNYLFDGKLIFRYIRKYLKDVEDGQLRAKAYLNHTNSYFARVGLKDLMKPYYPLEWTSISSYTSEDYLDEDFLRYTAIDGAATYYGWEILNKMEKEYTC